MAIFKEIPPQKLLIKTNIQTHKQKNKKSNPTTCALQTGFNYLFTAKSFLNSTYPITDCGLPTRGPKDIAISQRRAIILSHNLLSSCQKSARVTNERMVFQLE